MTLRVGRIEFGPARNACATCGTPLRADPRISVVCVDCKRKQLDIRLDKAEAFIENVRESFGLKADEDSA